MDTKGRDSGEYILVAQLWQESIGCWRTMVAMEFQGPAPADPWAMVAMISSFGKKYDFSE